jgi:hypothetical protein
MINTLANVTTTRYAFLQHTQRMARITLVAGIIFIVAGVIVVLAIKNLLPQGLGNLVAIAGLLDIFSFILLVPLLVFLYLYGRGGFWLEEQGVRVHFPGEAEQRMEWAEALYAIDEGDEYLASSKGKEGFGHLVGKERYVRLHLEGMTPGQRAEIKQAIAAHTEMRQQQLITFATLLNTKGEIVARGRLYIFENELLCAENRGKQRVFVAAPIKKLTYVRKRDPFFVGKFAFEAFVICYDKKEFVVMMGYEMTTSSGFGTSSRWSATGTAQEWIDALQPDAR